MARKGGDVGGPRTGDGRTGGKKPKNSELMMQNMHGVVSRSQPKGWTGMGKLLRLFKDDKK